MAGDWIKIEHGLLGKPEVMLLADRLDISHFEAVGHLIAFWQWVDLNLSPDCPRVEVTKKGLDRVAGRDGFADALISVGWMIVENGQISIPNYDVHLSKSAKERAKNQKKKALQRSKLSPPQGDKPGDKTGTDGGTREEKRREENEHTYIGSDLLDENVMCPDWLKIPFCRWLAYQFSRSGRNLEFVSQETMIFNLSKRGQEDAIKDIEFSISKQANSILDHKFDFQKARAGQIKADKPERKKTEVPSHRKF